MSASPRRVGPVVALILRELWELKLVREELAPVELDPAAHLFGTRVSRVEYFQALDREKWKFKDSKDRRIAFALAEGIGINRICRTHHVGQYRVELVLGEMVKGRKSPWHKTRNGQWVRTQRPVPRRRLSPRKRNQRPSKSRPSSTQR